MPGANLSNYNNNWYLHAQKALISSAAYNIQHNYYYNKSIYVNNKYVVILGGNILKTCLESTFSNMAAANIGEVGDIFSSSMNANTANGISSEVGNMYDFTSVVSKIDFPRLSIITSNDTYYNPVSLHKEDVPVQAKTDGELHITFEENQEYYIGTLLDMVMAQYLSYRNSNGVNGEFGGASNDGKIQSMRKNTHINNAHMYGGALPGEPLPGLHEAANTDYDNQMINGINVLVCSIVIPRGATPDSNVIKEEITSDNGYGDLVPLYYIYNAKPVSISPSNFDHSTMSFKTWDLTLKCNPINNSNNEYISYMNSINRPSSVPSTPVSQYNTKIEKAVISNLKAFYKGRASRE